MTVAAHTQGLLDLAKSRSPDDRERLLLAVSALCDADGGRAAAAAGAQALLSSVFMSIVVEAERDIRKRLAERLSAVAWAPPTLINVLALDDIEIARPVIASSPVLEDQDLVRLLVEATIEHQIEVARRPQIGPPVVAAILELDEPAVLTALADNLTAAVSESQLLALIERARRVTSLRTPLSRHPKLTSDLALKLYAWVGEALREALAERFRLQPTQLATVLQAAVREAYDGSQSQGTLVVIARDDERETMEQKLVEKLSAAGQLKPGYLIRSLREGRLSLFTAALAKLGDFDQQQLRRAMDSDRPELLALACAAVGIDRSVFPTLLDLVRELNAGRPGGGVDGARRAAGAFGPFTPQVAGAAFRQAVQSVCAV